MNPAEWDGTRKLAAVAIVPALLLGGAVMNTSVLVVDVQTPDSPHLVVPVPMPLARAGLAFAPDEAKRVQVPELAEHLPEAKKAVAALREAPDGLFVEVHDGDEHVRITKEGDVLRVRVIDGSRTNVNVRFPLAAAAEALEAYDVEDRSFDTSDLVAALGSGPGGELVHVLDGEDEVSIRMW
ncbi:MAG: hypothetical protein Q8W44_04330 [Candidatus Palauibacterales bacterium]|nr:hypothetical protein [Candidatus Palauibacterales bacterium]